MGEVMKFMKRFAGLLICLLIIGCAAKETKEDSFQQDKLVKSQSSNSLIIKEITFNENAGVPEAVEKECNLLKELSEKIKTAAAGQYASISEGSSAAAGNADVLSIEIINLVGPGGGAWSGGKSLMIKGELTRKGKNAGGFKALRVSGGGFWGGYMGTCAILHRCVNTLGEDVAGWLQNPVDGAKLGNL